MKFGPYLLLKRLAVGGMAELYLAQDTRSDTLVVIKRILPYLSHEPDFVAMFLDEARIAAQLAHPNVVRVHTLDQLEGAIFIDMEYVEGHDLRRILNEEAKRGGSLPYGLAAHITAQVCAGLHYAHTARGVDGKQLNVIHRDVSPQNVMVGFNGEVKLVDFGIAKATSLVERSKPGVIKGKFLYLAPEQLSQERIDHRADLFSLGTMLYELTTGKAPFQRPSTEAIIFAIRGDAHESPEQVKPGYPAELARIVNKCLVKDRTQRYQSAAEIQRDLEQFAWMEGAGVGQEAVARYVAELFGEEEERTMVHIPTPGSAAPPEATSRLETPAADKLAPTYVRPAPGSAFEPEEDARTQAVLPSELQGAIAAPAGALSVPVTTALPMRRATAANMAAVGPLPESTVSLKGMKAPPPPEERTETSMGSGRSPAHGDPTAPVTEDPERSEVSLSGGKLIAPRPTYGRERPAMIGERSAAPPEERTMPLAQSPLRREDVTRPLAPSPLVPAGERTRPPVPGEGSHSGRALSGPVFDEAVGPEIPRPSLASDPEHSDTGPTDESPRTEEADLDGEEPDQTLSHAGEDDDETGALPPRPRAPRFPLIAAGAVAVLLTLVILAWIALQPSRRPQPMVEAEEAPAAAAPKRTPRPRPPPPPREAAPPAPARQAEAPPPRPVQSPPMPPPPAPPAEAPVTFAAPKGTVVIVNGRSVKLNRVRMLPAGSYTVTYRCPRGKTRRNLSLTVDAGVERQIDLPCR